jgi:phosphate transport system permease protein
MKLYTRRRLINGFSLTVSALAMLFGLLWLVWLLWTLFSNGFRWMDLALFTERTPPPGSAGGLGNAIIGSLLLSAVGVAVGTPIGILSGTYLAEFARNSKFAAAVRFVNDILLSAPSIILGVFIYGLVVSNTGHFSGWAGGLALALILLPVIVRTTEDMMNLVPDSLREAAAALGAPQWKVIVTVVYRACLNGFLTGLILAIARISGETAPLLFTSLNNQFWSTDMSRPIANLPVMIFQFAMSPYDHWQHLAWAGALLITLSILILNILARMFLRGKK